VTAAVINGGHAVDNGLSPLKDAIYLETVQSGSNNPYINIIVARTEDKDNPVYQEIVKAFQTDEVAKVIESAYQGAYCTVSTQFFRYIFCVLVDLLSNFRQS